MNIIPVRIPELPPVTSISLDDKIAIWITATNKTVHCDLADLRTLVTTGSTNSYVGVQNGENIIYIVPESDAGTQTVSIPGLAGKDFSLRREGFPLIKQEYDVSGNPTVNPNLVEYEILAAGGFRLTMANDLLIEGQRYDLRVYQLAPNNGTGSTTPTAITPASFITGFVPVTVNKALGINDVNKLIQLRGDANQLVITLPVHTTIKEHSVYFIETLINNKDVEHTIQVDPNASGQFIYMNNTSYTKLYMRPGENLHLYRGSDGWYVINDFGNIYNEIAADIKASYRVRLNELPCIGQPLKRAKYPRLWSIVQTFGSSLVSHADWTSTVTVDGRTVKPFHGCFSTGDGSTDFYLPDLRNMFLRGIKQEIGTDPERLQSRMGGYQIDQFKKHKHALPIDWGGNEDRSGIVGTPQKDERISPYDIDSTGEAGGTETRPENIGVLWTIKC